MRSLLTIALVLALAGCSSTAPTGRALASLEPRPTPELGTSLYCDEAGCVEVPLAPCPTEDSANCVWDAAAQGDRTGNSFIDIMGTAYYL